MTERTHPYRGRTAALATKHDKGSLIAPAMGDLLGLRVEEVNVDTDALGTFTGEVPRSGTQWEAAVDKARLGMRALGVSLGFGSEGSIAPFEASPLLLVDTELVVLVDDHAGFVIEAVEIGFSPPVMNAEVATDDLGQLPLTAAGFPDHALIVRPSGLFSPIFKGIREPEKLQAAIRSCAAASPEATAHVESDFRAHQHPWRRGVIARAAERLARRLASLCPDCGAPGWGISHHDDGAPCLDCGHPTRFPLVEHWRCAACRLHRSAPTRYSTGVDPGHCPLCNP